jgi:PPK2 family polyphosphate:nucleotide phosphotransferase
MVEQPLIPGPKVRLADFDPDYTAGMSRKEADEAFEDYRRRLIDLQTLLYADGGYAMLVVFQAMDAGGKDGTIKSVFSGVNPQGMQVVSFKVPSAEELAHDFLWRVHRRVPERGMIGVFNRSHYEDVLVVRVNNLVPPDVWQKRYDHINQFEKLLADNRTVVLKFYLHISKAEQKKRFEERLREPDKHWKFNSGDLKVRERWDDYMAAYEAVFEKCSTVYAPWHIVPANEKWYRNLVVTRAIVEALEKLPLRYPESEPGLENLAIPD